MASDMKPAVAEAVEEVKDTVEAAGQAVADAAAHPAAEPSPTEQLKDTVKEMAEEVKQAVKDVAEEMEKAPVVGKVIGRVRETAEEIDKSQTASRLRQTVKDTAESVEKSPLVNLAHKVLLAGVGAVGLAQDEVEEFIDRLVDRGQIAEDEGKKVVRDVLDKRKKLFERRADAARHVGGDLEQRVAEAIDRLNIPTKDEIEALNDKITALTRKLDELKKSA